MAPENELAATVGGGPNFSSEKQSVHGPKVSAFARREAPSAADAALPPLTVKQWMQVLSASVVFLNTW